MTALEALKIGSYSTTGTTLELLNTPMINVAGGGDTPTYVTAGATVNIISGASLEFTGLKADTEVRVYLGT